MNKKTVALSQDFTKTYREAYKYYEAGDFEKASKLLKPLVDLGPEEGAPYKLCGFSLFRTGQYQEAVKGLKKGVEKDPEHEELHLLLGEALISAERAEEGLSYLREASEKFPKDRKILLVYSSYAYKMGLYQEALDAANKVLEMDENDVEAKGNSLWIKPGHFGTYVYKLQSQKTTLKKQQIGYICFFKLKTFVLVSFFNFDFFFQIIGK